MSILKPLYDNSIMPFGPHKGKKLIEVPATYLLYLKANNKDFGMLKTYIAEREQSLIKTAKDEHN